MSNQLFSFFNIVKISRRFEEFGKRRILGSQGSSQNMTYIKVQTVVSIYSLINFQENVSKLCLAQRTIPTT